MGSIFFATTDAGSQFFSPIYSYFRYPKHPGIVYEMKALRQNFNANGKLTADEIIRFKRLTNDYPEVSSPNEIVLFEKQSAPLPQYTVEQIKAMNECNWPKRLQQDAFDRPPKLCLEAAQRHGLPMRSCNFGPMVGVGETHFSSLHIYAADWNQDKQTCTKLSILLVNSQSPPLEFLDYQEAIDKMTTTLKFTDAESNFLASKLRLNLIGDELHMIFDRGVSGEVILSSGGTASFKNLSVIKTDDAGLFTDLFIKGADIQPENDLLSTPVIDVEVVHSNEEVKFKLYVNWQGKNPVPTIYEVQEVNSSKRTLHSFGYLKFFQASQKADSVIYGLETKLGRRSEGVVWFRLKADLNGKSIYSKPVPIQIIDPSLPLYRSQKRKQKTIRDPDLGEVVVGHLRVATLLGTLGKRIHELAVNADCTIDSLFGANDKYLTWDFKLKAGSAKAMKQAISRLRGFKDVLFVESYEDPRLSDGLIGEPAIPEKWQFCSAADDCTVVQSGACGCGGMGTNSGIRKDSKLRWEKRVRQRHLGCLAAISNDWTCTRFKPDCVEGRCVLTKVLRRHIEVDGSGAKFSDHYDAEAIRRVLNNRIVDLQACYEDALNNEDQSLSGNLLLHFEVGKSGQAFNFSLSGSTIKSKHFHECVVEKVSKISYPIPPKGEPIKVEYPIEFRLADD